MRARTAGTFATASFRTALVTLVFGGPLWLSAATINISATVPSHEPPVLGPTRVILKGFAYPSSRVTVEKDGGVAVIVPADPAAKFNVEITDLTPGTHTFSVYAQDQEARVGRPSNFTITMTQGTTTEISGIFLGPTIAVNQESLHLGDTVTLLGMTVPESAVTIIVSSEVERSFATNADTHGVWVRQLLASDLGLGTHSARAKAVAPTSEISAYSNTVSFSVTEGPPKPCDGKRPGDINCDGRVNLVDFSLMLYYWKQSNPANARADMNQDGTVNIKDFSILLFWWTW